MSGQGFVLWLTGLSGAGKTTISARVAEELRSRSVPVEVLDGDVVRMNLSSDLGFSHADRETNIRRIAFVAELLSRHGVAVITAAISPYRSMREEARARIGERFVEVFVDAPLATCEERDPKGLYARARAGEIESFTGIDDPYEEPLNPEIAVHTGEQDPEDSALEVIRALEERGLIEAPARAAAS